MYKEHPVFEKPENEDVKIWRYMDFTKFVSLLEKQALFFCRTDKLGDLFEGSYTKVNIERRSAIYKKKLDSLPAQLQPFRDVIEREPKNYSGFLKMLRKHVYVNCWHKNTSFKVYLELCDLLGYKLTQNKNGEEPLKVVKGILNEKSAVFVFDEIDKMEEWDFLYSILEGIYRKSVILMTNYKDWLGNVEERIMSRLMLDQLEFRPYNCKETEGILKQRISYAFVGDVFDEAAFKLILDKTAGMGDIRAGLTMLREAGLNAENRSSKKITADDAKAAMGKLSEINLESSDGLGDEFRAILNIIKQNEGLKMGELFKLYQKEGGEGAYRSFFRKVNKLADDKFVSLEKREGGAEGTCTIVKYLKANKGN